MADDALQIERPIIISASRVDKVTHVLITDHVIKYSIPDLNPEFTSNLVTFEFVLKITHVIDDFTLQTLPTFFRCQVFASN